MVGRQAGRWKVLCLVARGFIGDGDGDGDVCGT